MERNPTQTAGFRVPPELADILTHCPHFIVAKSVDELVALALRDTRNGYHEVAYDVPGRGRVVEARVCRVKNGLSANYCEPYMRRRDPDCMVIGDDQPTNKPTFRARFGKEFNPVREETFAWLKTQELALFAFEAGVPGQGIGAVAVAPANAGFFAFGLALLQGILDPTDIGPDFAPGAVIYVAPPFRHTHFEGRQIVVHNRRPGLHELFSYNLYPGPSAKKGVYGVLLALGEQENWVTAHCSTVQVITPYEHRITLMHEGASGGGKSEMLEHIHRRRDGSLLLGRNLVTHSERTLILPRACKLRPVTDDMALCHPSLRRPGSADKLTLMDAEKAWFVRVNHITRYGVDPHLEELTIHPPRPLLFLNIDAHPDSTALIWEHIEDEPGQRCPNPRVVVPRDIVPDIVQGTVTVDIRSLGVRTPPCTREQPSYGIIGLMHLLPPALAWIWRLVAPRGHSNPSIVQKEAMSSEGVGSYWPFATGRRVVQANLILQQIVSTPKVRYILCPNQHVGAWEVGFMPQWLAREYLARRGGARFTPEQVVPARCPLIGYALRTMTIEGQTIADVFLRVDMQPEVGGEAYDAGAAVLREFIHKQVRKFLEPDLDPLGRQIIECCLADGSLAEYEALIPHEVTVTDW
ncbi:MAG: DUF4914 family protein [Verrucomicrobia bacterium]|nr:DUF4914 family protein [Verrucomicrobiota bacterium]